MFIIQFNQRPEAELYGLFVVIRLLFSLRDQGSEKNSLNKAVGAIFLDSNPSVLCLYPLWKKKKFFF